MNISYTVNNTAIMSTYLPIFILLPINSILANFGASGMKEIILPSSVILQLSITVVIVGLELELKFVDGLG